MTSVLDTIESVYELQKLGGKAYTLSDVVCWCGGVCVLDLWGNPVCLALPFHDPASGPVSPRSYR